MPITRADLVKNVAQTLNREDVLENGVALSWVPKATARLNQELRINEMLAHVEQPLKGPKFTLPFNFIAVKTMSVFNVTTDSLKDPLFYCPPEDVPYRVREYCNTGWPRLYTLYGREAQIKPYTAGQNLKIDLRYYAELADLSTDASTNSVLARYPDLYEKAMLIYGHRYLMEKDMSDAYDAEVTNEIARLMTRKETEKYGEGALIIRPTRRIGGRFS